MRRFRLLNKKYPVHHNDQQRRRSKQSFLERASYFLTTRYCNVRYGIFMILRGVLSFTIRFNTTSKHPVILFQLANSPGTLSQLKTTLAIIEYDKDNEQFSPTNNPLDRGGSRLGESSAHGDDASPLRRDIASIYRMVLHAATVRYFARGFAHCP